MEDHLIQAFQIVTSFVSAYLSAAVSAYMNMDKETIIGFLLLFLAVIAVVLTYREARRFDRMISESARRMASYARDEHETCWKDRA